MHTMKTKKTQETSAAHTDAAEEREAIASHLRRRGVDVRVVDGHLRLTRASANKLLASLKLTTRWWRVTRRQPYIGTEHPWAIDLAQRTAYYVQAPEPGLAAEECKRLFFGDTAGFTVQRFDHPGDGAYGEVVGEFFVAGQEGVSGGSR
jgi:hypothetical protein